MNALTESRPVENLEAEAAVLATILTNPEAFEDVARIINAETFSEEIHRMMFSAFEQMAAVGEPIKPVFLKSYIPWNSELEPEKTFGAYVAHIVANNAMPRSMVNHLARAVHDTWLRRDAIMTFRELSEKIANPEPGADILDEIATLEERLADIRAKRLQGADRPRAGAQYLTMMEKAARNGNGGVPIVLKEIQTVLSEPAFEAGNLYGLLSSSGEGKTSLTIQIITHALMQGHPVCFMSFDQSAAQIVRQMVTQRHDITARRQKEADLSDKEWGWAQDVARWVDEQPFEIIKCSRENAARLVGMARQFVKRYGNGKTPLIVLDHILAVPSENERAHEGEKANQKLSLLKTSAGDLGAAWLVLNQRSSAGMKRMLPRPILADMYGGEQAIQPYDGIFYLFRWLKHYKAASATAVGSDHKKLNEIYPENVRNETEDLAEIGALKVRFGSPNIRKTMEFEAQFTRYRSLENKPQEELL
jgi:replicative DNA helicase